MTTYSKKYFNEETQKWEPLYSTEGRSAIKKVEQSSEESNQELLNKISEVNTNLTNKISKF